MHATEADIKKAIQLWAEQLNKSADTRHWPSLLRFVQLLDDYPEHHDGNIVELTEKAIRWHMWREEVGDTRTRIAWVWPFVTGGNDDVSEYDDEDDDEDGDEEGDEVLSPF